MSVRSGRLKGQAARRWLRGNENRLEIARLNSEMIESRPCLTLKARISEADVFAWEARLGIAVFNSWRGIF